MQISWAQRVKQQHTKEQKPSLKVHSNVYTTKPKSNDENDNNYKSKIPLHIRLERDPDTDDDIVIHNKKEPISIISNDKFILNHFDAQQKTIFFQLTLPFLDTDDTLNFLKCCQKYAKIYNKNNGLLYIWKHLYQREYKMSLRKRRRSKRNPEQRIQRHKQQLLDYKYWKHSFQLKDKKKFIIKFDHQNDKLSFYRSERYFELINENYMVIITANHCKSHQLLDGKNFIWSNWYDIEDTLKWRKVRKEWREYKYKWRRNQRYYTYIDRYAKSIVIEGKDVWSEISVGFENLNVYVMMENMYISPNGTRGYVHAVEYNELKCDLMEIMPFEMNKEQRKCKLMIKEDGQVIEGVILNRIVSVEELQSKMLKCIREYKQLTVMVYHMRFTTDADDPYIVTDYFDE